MDNRIDACFRQLAEQQQRALVAYVTAGDPDLEFTAEAVRALVRGGADMVELGLPFSDPLADGPVIQAASQRALEEGFRIGGLLDAIDGLRSDVAAPLMVMSYYNPILQYGIDRFCGALAAVGGDGLLIPDLPHEEEHDLREAAGRTGLRMAAFAAPTSTDRRLEQLSDLDGGFVYCVSVAGVTGVRSSVSTGVRDLVNRVRRHVNVPVVVGFGISRPQHAREVGAYADGVVVGSAFVRLMAGLKTENSPASRDHVVQELEDLARALKSGLVLAVNHAD